MVDLFKFSKENNVAVRIQCDPKGYAITLSRNVHNRMTVVTDDIVKDEKHLECVLNDALFILNKQEEEHKELINDWRKRTK